MIRVDFLVSPKGELKGFSVKGHADYAESGSDIVCAAVSSAAYMAANTITDVLRVSAQTQVDEGSMMLMIPMSDMNACRTVMEGLKLHMTGLEEQYPDYINVFYLEV